MLGSSATQVNRQSPRSRKRRKHWPVPVRSTILGTLRAEVQGALRHSPTNTLLWLDPLHEWERLLDQLVTDLELVRYDGSQPELRVKIEVEPVQTSRIV